jgi:hypothetical protein
MRSRSGSLHDLNALSLSRLVPHAHHGRRGKVLCLTGALDAVVCSSDLDKRDVMIKLLLGCTADKKKAICAFYTGGRRDRDSHRKKVNFRAWSMREFAQECQGFKAA